MYKARRYFHKIALFMFKSLAVPFFGFFSGFFFIFVILGYFTKSIGQADYLPIVQASTILSLLFSIMVFACFVTLSLPEILENERFNFFKKHFPKTRKVAIQTKTELRPYLLVVAMSSFVIFVSVLIKMNEIKPAAQLSLSNFPILSLSYASTFIFLLAWVRCYSPEEKAVFLLERFYMREPRRGVSALDFENALKNYQKVFSPPYSYCSLKERMKQLQLILDRGTKEEISKVQVFACSLSSSIETHDEPSFDNSLITLCQFIEQKANEKSSVFRINQSRKERFRSYVENMSGTFLEKALPLVLLAILLYIIYWASGIKITVA